MLCAVNLCDAVRFVVGDAWWCCLVLVVFSLRFALVCVCWVLFGALVAGVAYLLTFGLSCGADL